MKIGFTGTRKGMTPEQKRSFERWLGTLCIHGYADKKIKEEDTIEFHHGCCVGCDADAHALFLTVMNVVGNLSGSMTVLHPPDVTKLIDEKFLKDAVIYGAAYYTGNPRRMQRVVAPTGYLARNKDIVDATDMLIACPGAVEVLRSGTWSTIRYARDKKKPLMIIWPDGKFKTEELWSVGKDAEALKATKRMEE